MRGCYYTRRGMPQGVPDYLAVSYGTVEVAWTPDLDGGGRGFGQDFLPVVALMSPT